MSAPFGTERGTGLAGITWDDFRPRTMKEACDLGVMQFPVAAEKLVLTDRADGKSLWLLGVSPQLTLQLTTPPAKLSSDSRVYAPREEPVIGSNRIFAVSQLDSHGNIVPGTVALSSETAGAVIGDAPVILSVPGNSTKLGLVSVQSGAVTLTVIPRP